MICMNAEFYVMASGKGTRLAPYSLTSEGNLPKQFLNVVGNNTMIQDTVLRIPSDCDVTVIPEFKYIDVLKKQMSDINREVNVLAEPYPGNTALLTLLGTLDSLNKNDDEKVVFFLASDAVMDKDVFQKVISDSMKVFENYPEADESILTIGIEPDRPEINYGYIKVGDDQVDDLFYKVKEFKEKPRFEVAERYVESGNYLWNSAILAFKPKTMLKAMKEHAPNLYEKLDLIKDNLTLDNLTKAYDYIPQNEKISIDFAILQKMENILLVPASKDLKWDDVGGWAAVEKYHNSDFKNNTSNLISDDGKLDSSKLELIKTKNCTVFNYTDKKITLNDCEDLIVILAPSGCFISKRKGTLHAKDVVSSILEGKNLDEINCKNCDVINNSETYLGVFDVKYVGITFNENELFVEGDPKSKINVRWKR